MDVNHPLPHAKIEFANPFDPVIEANMLNIGEKRDTSHQNDNQETHKQGCKLCHCPAEISTMDMSSFRNQGGHLGFLSKDVSKMSLDCKVVMALLPGSNAPSLASTSVPSMGNTKGWCRSRKYNLDI